MKKFSRAETPARRNEEATKVPHYWRFGIWRQTLDETTYLFYESQLEFYKHVCHTYIKSKKSTAEMHAPFQRSNELV